MEFVLVPSGRFDMGLKHPPDDLRPAPVHQVRFTRPIFMGRFEVTQEQWRRVMGSSSHSAGSNAPWRRFHGTMLRNFSSGSKP
jgi:formylglycine-generating enzyme required for sulfatase activity